MSGRIFVDTNVLVYAYDRSEPAKQRQALTVLDYLATARAGVISTQVLDELFVTVTRKIATPLTVADSYRRLVNYAQTWKILHVTGMITLEAARGVRDHQFSFWDAQIWATARLNQIPAIFSEDFGPNSVVEGVRFVNPFAQDFRLEQWS